MTVVIQSMMSDNTAVVKVKVLPTLHITFTTTPPHHHTPAPCPSSQYWAVWVPVGVFLGRLMVSTLYLLLTCCYIPATYRLYTCYTPAIHLFHNCYKSAIFLPYICCYIPAATNMLLHLPHTCYILLLLYTCYISPIHLLHTFNTPANNHHTHLLT